MILLVFAFSFLLQFAAQVLAVVIGLWIWNNRAAIVPRTKRTSS